MVLPIHLLGEGESTFTEYKRNFSPSALKTVSAFANFHDGRILVGVADDGSIVGLADIKNARLDIEHSVNDAISPRPLYEIDTIEIDGKPILVLQVFKGEATPYYYHGKAYSRNDTSTVEADRTQLNRLILEGTHTEFEEQAADEQVLQFKKLEELLKDSLGITSLTDDLLRTLQLLRNGRYCNAAALLSDRNPVEGADLLLVSYLGNSMDASDSTLLQRTSLLTQYEEAAGFFKKHINTGFIIRGDKREEWEEVPLAAFREAIANALVHRDYLAKGSVRVEIHPDRIEVVSPGGLPAGISVEEYRTGRLSVLRNGILADVFFRLHLMEKMASGVRRIKELYKNRERNPVFDPSANAIHVLLPRQAMKPDAVAEPEVEPRPRMTAPMQMLFDWLLEREEGSRAEAQGVLGLGKTRTYQILGEMKERRIIVQLGSGRTVRYRIHDKYARAAPEVGSRP